MKRLLGLALAALLALVLLGYTGVVLSAGSPSSDRVWADGQEIQPSVSFTGRSVRIEGVRDFAHAPDGTVTEAWRDWVVPLQDVRAVWFALAPFEDAWEGLAHAFVSFELADGRHLAISVEARREEGETYTLKGGLTRRFETTYVIGTEPDLLGLRALRGDVLYLYPSRATPEQAQSLLIDMLRRAEMLRREPEWYNTLTNNCATNLRAHVNRVATEPLPLGWATLFPGYSDELALERGLLATDLPLEQARARYRVDEKVRAALAEGAQDLSQRIRAGG